MSAERTFTLDEIRRIVGPPECYGNTQAALYKVRRTPQGRQVASYCLGPDTVPVMVYCPTNGVRTIWAPAEAAADITTQALRDAGYILAEDIGL